jgi:hypothetical protein
MIRSAAIALLLANAALANEPAATDVEVQELPPPAPEAAIALPMARLDTRAFIVADKRIELSAQWTSDQGPVYLERVTVYFLMDDGSVVRDIGFDVRDMRAGYNFSRRLPLEPSADLVGICAVYAASKDAPRVRSAALFLNKGEGERSELKSAPAPAEDKTGGCFAFAPQ